MDRELSCCASGSRRSCAAAAVINSLGAVDLVAAVVPGEHHRSVVLSLHEALETEPGIAVVRTDPTDSGWLRRAEEHDGRRVLLWEEVDRMIREDPRRFDQAVHELCRILSADPPGEAPPVLHRAILVGGHALMDHLGHLLRISGDEVRFRYILVE